MEEYSIYIKVDATHLDELRHVNNVVYLQWVQEAARAHWSSKVNEEIMSNYFWVVRTHHLDYKRQAFIDEEIEARTYVVSFKGPLSERAVDFYRDGELLVAARSHWCLLDATSQKPKRVPEEVQSLFGSRATL